MLLPAIWGEAPAVPPIAETLVRGIHLKPPSLLQPLGRILCRTRGTRSWYTFLNQLATATHHFRNGTSTVSQQFTCCRQALCRIVLETLLKNRIYRVHSQVASGTSLRVVFGLEYHSHESFEASGNHAPK